MQFLEYYYVAYKLNTFYKKLEKEIDKIGNKDDIEYLIK